VDAVLVRKDRALTPNSEENGGRGFSVKQAVIAALLIAAGAVLAHLHVVAQTYHPLVRLAAPDGLVYTALQDPTSERQACGEANERFIAPLRQHCKDCKVMLARCERELEGFERALYDGAPLAVHRVLSPGLRMAIAGPQPAAKSNCDFLARALVKYGFPSATCVDPTSAS
jgi:hypothetical protein